VSTPTGQYVVVGLVYLCLIFIAEAITTMVEPWIGMVLHGVVLLLVLIHGSSVQRGILRRFLILLSLAPLIRMLSLSLPLARLGLPIIYWYMVIGALLFIAAFVAGRITDLHGQRIGWSWRTWPLQLIMGLTGFGLGYVEYRILNPGPLAAYVTWVDYVVAGFILLVFTGVLEEYIFRGLMQSASMQLMGRGGLVYIAVLFAVLHLGYHSFIDLLFVLSVGLYFGWWVWKTHSLIGASIAHGVANIALYVIFPVLLSSGSLPVASSAAQATGTAPAVTLAAGEILATATASAGLPPADVLVDNESAGFVFAGAKFWLDVTHGYGGNFRWTYASQYYPDVVGTWIPNLHGCGWYRVEAFIPQGDGLTESARYTIHSWRGTTEAVVNQSVRSGAWVGLGTFEFESGMPANIQLPNQTGEDPKLLRWVAYDAMRWILARACSSAAGPPS
jgi:membrane protease YdiL (CAAX protease family)